MGTDLTLIKKDLERLAESLERIKREPGPSEDITQLKNELRQLQKDAHEGAWQALAKHLVDLAKAIIEIRLRPREKGDSELSQLPIPQYDLYIPFKAVRIHGPKDFRYDAELDAIANRCVSALDLKKKRPGKEGPHGKEDADQ